MESSSYHGDGREGYCVRRLYPGAVLVHEVNVLVTTHSKETETCQYNVTGMMSHYIIQLTVSSSEVWQ